MYVTYWLCVITKLLLHSVCHIYIGNAHHCAIHNAFFFFINATKYYTLSKNYNTVVIISWHWFCKSYGFSVAWYVHWFYLIFLRLIELVCVIALTILYNVHLIPMNQNNYLNYSLVLMNHNLVSNFSILFYIFLDHFILWSVLIYK